MIFETERLLIRKLNLKDVQGFHLLESNPDVLKYANGNVKTAEENTKELKDLINKYDKPKNDFWIYAIVMKTNRKFVGTAALVKDGFDDEIGYRFREEFCGNGYGFEVCKGLLLYCKQIGVSKVIAYVVNENIASVKILKQLNFYGVKHFISEDMQLAETKYEIIL